ncbi:MAG: hypothetical protein COW32_05675 [Candidatus Aquicultor secundus]|uniref:Uncharacterized protein n=1 Tax=Candidatus Aquicultor secundus TaxID=1973895 RepID=A0A2M7T5A2_9ACTN|nr:hypothetical protein [Candidatus Aquicultor secundus]NCO65854.1 hypothetical protein [Solirubrobacter sp.]OIO86400.1 MAG: hypothetical protein AUK32_05605 [Candidatus Aquicultor secundus]PIU26359.1 MAG: hypothetical protein COT10_09125 [Candidatus Aquicultor secundus]PIW22245.1 MAG: hypothetical protein COW32_05675 [Candidatus Aquicultor secundus]PIX52836.1 MAG: hypothetical protein COZ51_02040 [Candidatus Aquicultor secundus]
MRTAVKLIPCIIAFSLGLLLGILIFEKDSSFSGQAVLKTAESDSRVRDFIHKTAKTSDDLEKSVALVWDHDKDIYYWKVTLFERKCGCLGPDKIDIAEIIVSPLSASVLSCQFRYSMSENAYSKEQCMKACHKNLD